MDSISFHPQESPPLCDERHRFCKTRRYPYGLVYRVAAAGIRGNGTAEAQAVAGDFGGAVFAKHGGQWQLAGIMVAAEGYSGQPSPELTAVFGNETFMADLSYYRN